MREVLGALERNESVTILHRGKAKAVLTPVAEQTAKTRVADHPAFGMWADRAELADVKAAVRQIRRGRTDAV